MTAAQDHLRRQGMADAAVLLVAKRISPTTSLNDWGRHLGLHETDPQAAVDRFRGRVRKPKRTGGGAAVRSERNLPCGHLGCEAVFDTGQGRGAHRRIHRSVDCEWCGGTFLALGIGPHRRHCPDRPRS